MVDALVGNDALLMLSRQWGQNHTMRFIITLLLLVASASAVAAQPAFPALTGRVVDQAGVISPAVERKLTAKLAAYERANGTQVVVATLKDSQGIPLRQYGYQLGRHWGIGQKGKDNGTLLLVVPSQKQVSIEVGYGLEGTLTDALTFNIINQVMLPQFKQGKLDAGIVAGTSAILQALGGTYTPVQPHETRNRSFGGLLMFFMLGMGLVPMLFGRRRRRSGDNDPRHHGGAGLAGGLLMGGMMGGYLGGGLGGGGGGGLGGGMGGFGGGGGGFGGGGAMGGW